MLTFFVLCSASSAYVMGTVLSSITGKASLYNLITSGRSDSPFPFTASAFPIPGGKFCVPKGVSTHFYAFWIPMLSFETLLCTLAVIRALQMRQPSRSLFHSGRQLVGVLVRDSLMYFLVLVPSSFCSLLVLGLTLYHGYFPVYLPHISPACSCGFWHL